MKVYINGRFLSQRVTGVQRFAREIVNALDKILQKSQNMDEWYIIVPKNFKNDLPTEKIKIKMCGKLTGHLWEQLELPFFAQDGILLNLCNCAPLIKKNQVITIHDAAIVAYPNAYSWKFRMWYKFLYFFCGKRADRIITVSEFSRNELNKYFNIPKDKISVVYNGIEHMERIDEDDSIIDYLKLREEKFVLAVSSHNKTKNFALVLRTAKRMPEMKFVITGGFNSAIFKRDSVEKLANVIYTGYISDEKLVSLYKHASVFVYPSLYEGFGIPPLEAISQGCSVIVSKCAALPEICGDNAVYCQIDDERDLSDKIKEVVLGTKWRGSVKQIMHVQDKYSWMKSAKNIYDILSVNGEDNHGN